MSVPKVSDNYSTLIINWNIVEEPLNIGGLNNFSAENNSLCLL